MEDYPQVQNTSNSVLPPQETISHAQKNIISPSVNGDLPVHPYYTDPIAPPSSTTTYGYPGEVVPGIANAVIGDSSDRSYTSAPGMPASSELYTLQPLTMPTVGSFPQPYASHVPQVPHDGDRVPLSLEQVHNASVHPMTIVPFPLPVIESNDYSLSNSTTIESEMDLPLVPIFTELQPAKQIVDPTKIINDNSISKSPETFVELATVPSVSKAITVVKQTMPAILESKESFATSEELGANAYDTSISIETGLSNHETSHTTSSLPTGCGEKTLISATVIEEPLPKQSIPAPETPVDVCNGKTSDPDDGKEVLPTKTASPVAEAVPQNDQNEKQCENEHSPASHSTQNESSDVSCLLKTAVIVQASLFEQIDPVEDVKPIVGGCIDDIGREDEPQETLALEPDRLLLDETEEDRDYDALDGIDAAKIDPIVPLEVPIFKSTKMIDEIDPSRENVSSEDNTIATKSDNLNKSTAHVSESEEEEPFEPDCGEMIGLSTDDEIELRQRMCANSVRRPKPIKKRASESRSEEDVSIVKSEKKDAISIKYELDESSNLPIPQHSRHRKKRRKIHTIRIVDVKKELLKIDDQNSEDSIESYASHGMKSNKREQVSSSSNGSNDSGSGLSCEEIVSDDNLRDIRDTKSKRRRSRNDASARVNSRAAKKVEEIAGLKLPAHQQQQLQTMVLKRKHTTRDRFYDRSQDIPNEIYFENMDVPLHILHDTSSSSSDEEPTVVSKHRKTSDYYSSSRNRPSSSSTVRYETGSHHSLQSMKMFLKMAGFRHMRYQKLWEGCHTTQERAEAILRFLQDNGLQGEPTVEKCRELRKQIQLENEAKVLDVSVIINAGEGRVTRQRTKMLTTTTAPSNSEQQKKVVETGQRDTPEPSESKIEEAPPQGNNAVEDQEIEQQKEGQQSTLLPENEATECHNEQEIVQQEEIQESNVQTGIAQTECHSEENIKKGQQQKVPDGEVQPEDEPAECHSEQQNTEIGQQLTAQEKSSQSRNEFTEIHNDQNIEIEQQEKVEQIPLQFADEQINIEIEQQEKVEQIPLQFADEQIKSHANEQTTQVIESQSGNEPSECDKEQKRASENQQKNQSENSSRCHDEKATTSLEQATPTEETAAVVSHSGLDSSGQVNG